MERLTTEQYKTMCDGVGLSITLLNKLISATQARWGTVDNVVKYTSSGLVIFANGERWIFNWNNLYPRFYDVTPSIPKEEIQNLEYNIENCYK